MGMFDTIIIEGLKLKAPKEVTSFLKANNSAFPSEFQTKDLYCVLATYRINEKGDVFEDVRKPSGKKIPYELPFSSWVDDRPVLERLYFKFKNRKQHKDSRTRLVEEYKTVKVKSKLTNTITALSYDEIGGRNLSLDYEFKIVEGKVKTVKLLKYEIESENDAKKRYKDNEEFKLRTAQEISIRKAFRAKWYYPILREIYNPFIFFTKLAVQSVCNKLVHWSYRWTGV